MFSTFQKQQAQAFALVLLGCAVLGAHYLPKEFWGEEVSTLARAVGSTGPATLGSSPASEDLLFQAVITPWIKVCSFLGLPLFSIRIPSWLSAIAATGFLLAFVRRCRGLRPALFSALLLATSHPFLSTSCQLRGYSLSMLCTAAALCFAVHFLDCRSRRSLWPLLLVQAAGTAVISTNWPVFMALGLWTACECWDRNQPGGGSPLAQGALVLGAPLIGPLSYLLYTGTRARYLQSIQSAMRGTGLAGTILKEWCTAVAVDLVLFAPLILAGYFFMLKEKRSGDREDAKGLSWQLTFSLVPLVLAFQANTASALLPLLPWWCAVLGMLMDEGCWVFERRRPGLGPFFKFLAPFILLLGLFREAQFANQYRQRFEERRPESLYYQYYQVDFRPSEVAAFLARGSASEELAAFVHTQDDAAALEFYAKRSGLKNLYRIGTLDALKAAQEALRANLPIYVIARNEEEAVRQLNLATLGKASPERLEKALDTGYYKVFQLRR